jgi:hypothetical protein
MASMGIAALIASATAAATLRLVAAWRRQVGGRHWDSHIPS